MRFFQAPIMSKLLVAALMALLFHPWLVESRPVDEIIASSITCDLQELDYACNDMSKCPPIDPLQLWSCTDFYTQTRYSISGEYGVFTTLIASGNPAETPTVTFSDVHITIRTNSDPLIFYDSGMIQILPQTTIQFMHEENLRNLAQVTGTNTLLVVRLIDSSGDAASWNASKLSDEIFGTFGDSITLKSVMDGCSNGQLILQPYPTTSNNGVVNGVIELTLDVDFDTYDNLYPATEPVKDWEDLKDYAITKLTNLNRGFPNYASPASNQQVLLFTSDAYRLGGPVGSNYDGWASIGGGYSIFNGFSQLQTLVHEIGHNLGLRHSGLGEATYGDK